MVQSSPMSLAGACFASTWKPVQALAARKFVIETAGARFVYST